MLFRSSDGVIYTSQGGRVFFSTGKSGGTPDMILPDGIVEIKCPSSHTHLQYYTILTSKNFQDELPTYYDQMQHNMYLCERNKCYFVSYDPRISKGNILILEIKKDEARVSEILSKIEYAHKYMNSIIEIGRAHV